MSEENKEFETWEEVILDFFEHKIASSSLYKSREKIKGMNNELDQLNRLNNDQLNVLDRLYVIKVEIDGINKKVKELNPEKKKISDLDNATSGQLKSLSKQKKQLADEKKQISTVLDNNEQMVKIKHLLVQNSEFRKSVPSEIREWLESNSIRPGRIVKATHVLRFSNSSSSAEGILLIQRSRDKLLTTSSIRKDFIYDMAHNNGNLVSVSRFLALNLSGKLIFDCIFENDFEFLESFAEDEAQKENWRNGFLALIDKGEIKKADKVKQMYFPLSKEVKLDADGNIDDNNYHLITPLFSSSLAEELYSLQIDLKYGEEQTSVRQANKGNASDPGSGSRYHSQSLIEFPRLAVQKFGGAQPQNVSMLNKNRGGRSYLLSTQSPIWQSQLQPPIKQKSLFGHGFYLPGTKEDIDYLREYLLRFERVALSIKNPERFKWIERWLGKITDEFLTYIASIQKLPAGWSSMEDITLKSEHQYLLDPFRADSEFQSARKVSDWQNTVCNDFGWWLNNRLRGKDKKFTPQAEHRRMWAKLLESPLRQHNELVESERKRKAGVGA